MARPDAKPTTAPRLKRRWRRRPIQYAVLVFNLCIAAVCFATAGVLIVGQQVINGLHKTSAIVAAPETSAPTISLAEPNTNDATGSSPTQTDAPVTVETFPNADPGARNFLITGSDNNACNDPNSPTAVEDRPTLGERSDTIMIMRVDPTTSRAAVLSFPRDLWVKIHGLGSKNRINGAYKVNDPQRLIDTIRDNFGIDVDHYIQIDFCAFKTLVDSVNGVAVPFDYPARDKNTGLDVPAAGCYTFNGSSALAYVRSRHYQYFDPVQKKWRDDLSSDYGRIARQQDFLRRAVAKVLEQGFSLSIARSLLTVAKDYVVVDQKLSLDKELQFAGVLKNLRPDDIHTYRVEGTGTVIGGASVILPNLTSDNMKAILAIFRGEAQLESAPDQSFDEPATTAPRTTSTTVPTSTSTPRSTGGSTTGSTTKPATTTSTSTSTTSTTTTTTLPPSAVSIEQDLRGGIVPPKDQFCS